MRKTMMKDGKVLRLQEFVDEQIVELNVNYRLHNIRKRQKYEDDKDPDENVFEKVINFKNNINLDQDLKKARRDLLKSDFQNFIKLMNFTLTKSETKEKKKKPEKRLKNKILRRFEIDALLNEKKDHKNCFYFHYKKDFFPNESSPTFKFKKREKIFPKSNSTSNFFNTTNNKINKENQPKMKNTTTSSSFDKMLRNTGINQKFVFNDSLKVSQEKANFIVNQKEFCRKKEMMKTNSILLPEVKEKFESELKKMKEKYVKDTSENEEKEEIVNAGKEDNPELIKKRIILPADESPKIKRRDYSKSRKTLKMSRIIFDEDEISQYDEKKRLEFLKTSKINSPKKPTRLKKISSVTDFHLSGTNFNEKKDKHMTTSFKNFYGSTNNLQTVKEKENEKLKKIKLFLEEEEKRLEEENNKRKNIEIENKKEDPSEKWDLERKKFIVNNINKEFSRLKHVKSEIHKTFDTALAELYDKAVNKPNKTKKTADSQKSGNAV